MNTKQAIRLAQGIKNCGPVTAVEQALVELLDHGDRIQAPDFEMIVRMLGANIHAQGKTFIEIAVDPTTKEVAHSFETTKSPLEIQTSPQIRLIVFDALLETVKAGEITGEARADVIGEQLDAIMKIVDGLLREISRREDALDHGQKNCDDVFEDLKREREEARAEAASLRLEIENLRAHGWQLPHG